MGFVEEQLSNQVLTYGKDPLEMVGEERAQYLRDMTLALTEELHELLRENSWKPWHKGRDGYGSPRIDDASEDSMIAWKTRVALEFGDIMCFLGNLARAHGLTTDEVIAGHRAKLVENQTRHADQRSVSQHA